MNSGCRELAVRAPVWARPGLAAVLRAGLGAPLQAVLLRDLHRSVCSEHTRKWQGPQSLRLLDGCQSKPETSARPVYSADTFYALSNTALGCSGGNYAAADLTLRDAHGLDEEVLAE